MDAADAILLAKQIEADPSNSVRRVAKVELYDLDKMAARDRKCLDCGAEIACCYWIQKCDDCLDAMVNRA